MTVNFKSPEGLQIMHRLIKQSDVLVENFVSGKLATLNLGWEDCKKINPRLIYTSITGACTSADARVHLAHNRWVSRVRTNRTLPKSRGVRCGYRG